MSKLLYINISDDIEKQIQQGILKEYDRLSERKLAETYGVSRTVIREALKKLNEKGLVDTQSGRGSFVSVPDNHVVMDKFISTINNSSLKVEDVVEAREILESVVVEYIVERATTEDIAELKALVEKMKETMEDGEVYAELDGNFHKRLMACVKNEVLELVMGALNSLTNRSNLYRSIEERQITHLEHQLILDNLIQRNKEGLKAAILDHLTCARARMGMEIPS